MPKTLAATKHFKLAQHLRKEIAVMQPGDTLPTVMELQRNFGVSQATVERALDRLRKEGLVIRPSGQLRLVVAEQSDPAAHRVALIRPDYPSASFEELARVIVDAGKSKDWAFDLIHYRKMESIDLRRDIGDNDAAILLPTTEAFPESLMASLKRPRRPVVVIQDPPVGLRVSSVRIDDVEIGKLAVKHLVELGHQRILLFLNEPMAPSGALRAQGWREAMIELGQTNIEELVVDCHLKPFDNSITQSYQYFSDWLAKPHTPFTAIFCACASGAVAVLRALREHNLSVPNQISVISHGGESYMAPFLYPALTAVETDIPAYGRVVVQQLDKQLQNHAEPVESIVVPSVLVVRQTTAPVAS